MQQIDDIGEDYDKLRQKVISWCSNRTEQDNGGPKPMDIGSVAPGYAAAEGRRR